ncbi:MAG: hypothetical protein WDO12_11230 [Pseudomonadota bacterium]
MNHSFGGVDMGALGLWLFLGAAVVAGAWEKNRKLAEKHETLRRIVEKTGTVDEAQLRELLNPSRAENDWLKSKPGSGYRALRVGGFVVMGIGAAIAVLCLAMGLAGGVPQLIATRGLCVAAAFATFGVALFLSSRFAEQPPGQGDGPAR